jgi:arylsulfatase A-like enzyme
MLQQIANPSMFGSNHALFFSVLKWNLGWDYTYLMEAHPPFFRPCREIIKWFVWAFETERPTFSMLWFNETHEQYRPDESEHVFSLDGMNIPLIDDEIIYYDRVIKEHDGINFRKHMAQYDGSIHNLDDAVKPILDLASDDVLIIICSDHGDWMGEYGHWFTHEWHNYMGRFSVAEQEDAFDVLRSIFLVMSQPSSLNGMEATLLDIAPTVCDWLGIEGRDWWEGKSLL